MEACKIFSRDDTLNISGKKARAIWRAGDGVWAAKVVCVVFGGFVTSLWKKIGKREVD